MPHLYHAANLQRQGSDLSSCDKPQLSPADLGPALVQDDQAKSPSQMMRSMRERVFVYDWALDLSQSLPQEHPPSSISWLRAYIPSLDSVQRPAKCVPPHIIPVSILRSELVRHQL
ncbi:hypothetical protein EMCG_04064 [[Emmonsia] crescens]|uniref:Uncharacterized protein n=1 Tax=[Emmonsia] crescens TaxID=73230 RepID=A0A0G2HUD4_9EURO|nr:hypothetical protein EMCG_04064 [Emmonsia crescens UAMH 3008]